MKKMMTQSARKSGYFSSALSFLTLLLALFAGGLTAQNPWPDYDFKAANADGDTLYYRITSAAVPYTVAVTRCHDSVYHTLPSPTTAYEVGQPGFLYPVYDYDSLVTIPSSVTYQGQTYTVTAVDKEAFYMQKAMHTVILPATVETIDSGAFHRSTIHQIVMSPNVKRINYYAFMSTPLESIELPSGLTHIGVWAFASTSLSEVEIPAGVTILPYQAFWGSPLTKIIFHEGLQEVQYLAFSAKYIDSLAFPSSLRKIALNSEEYYDNFDTIQCRYVEFKNGADPLELSDYCFLGFTNLEKVILSDNITRIGKSCFELAGMQQVVIPPLIDTIHESCFMACSNLNQVVLPQQLTTIDKFAFSETTVLSQIAIPASVTYIGKGAFRTAAGQGLEVLDIYCEVPPTIDANYSFNKQDTIHVRVPCGKTAVYQSVPGWSSYSNFVYEECVGVEEREMAEFKVYPNPTDDLLFVELSGAEIVNVALYDLQGRMVAGVHAGTPQPGATITLDVKSLPAGVYVLRVTDADGREYLRKVVKK
jgi:hypothetical protein